MITLSLLFLLGNALCCFASTLVDQKPLDGENCVPKYAVPLPVFGPAGSIPRVDASSHQNLTVTMKEINQAVLPLVKFAPCKVKFKKTRVWAYETKDTATGAVLGPAVWPAVTIVAKRGIATRVKYVNKLPSFNPSNPLGPGLVQGVLPFDQTIHWADPMQTMGHSIARTIESYSTGSSAGSSSWDQYIGPVPATVHLHGGEIPAAFDGNPDSWFTPNGIRGPGYNSLGDPKPGEAIYEYANSQEAGTLWFHDHTLGTTRLNVYAGLAGFYFLKDPALEPKGYPSGPYEIEMAIQDRLFDTNSQLYFPQQQQVSDHPFWSVYFEGDVATVNGAAFPYLKVEPRRYRFHLLNGANHRGFLLSFGSATVYQIGADDNYLDEPVKVSTVSISPGERVDIIVDFSGLAGQNIEVDNSAGHIKVDLKHIMEFQVGSRSKPDTSCDPANPNPSAGICARKDPLVRLTDGKGHKVPGVKIDRVRQLTFYDYVTAPLDNNDYPATIKEFVNNTEWNGLESPSIAYDFPTDGVSELPRVGSIEKWEIAFVSTMGAMAAHPFHIHLAQFQILSRQEMQMSDTTSAKGYLSTWQESFGDFTDVPLLEPCKKKPHQFCPGYGPPLRYVKLNDDKALGGNPAFGPYLLGDAMPPNPGESGWKDTADMKGGEVMTLLVRWTPSVVPVIPNHSYAGYNWYEFDPTEGSYVWHCHVINHEDNEMMRPYRVTK